SCEMIPGRKSVSSSDRLQAMQGDFWGTITPSALHLLGLQPAKLLAPPIIRPLAHPDLADCVRHGLPLRDQNVDLPQLRHYSPPGCQRHTSSRTTSMGADQIGRI